MPARITIIRGVSAGTVHEIYANYQRIGSDLSCDMCLPSSEIPPQAFLLEYVESARSYRIHCRSKDAVYHQGRLMNPGEKRDWSPGQELSIGAATTLTLQTDPDPKPVAPESRRTERQRDYVEQLAAGSTTDPSMASTTTEPVTKSSKTDPRLFIVVLCLAACPLLLFSDQIFPPAAPSAAPPMTYATLVELLKNDDDCPNGELYLDLLRQAHREQNRSKAEAKTMYLRLRTKIMNDIESEDAGKTKTQHELLRFVGSAITRL